MGFISNPAADSREQALRIRQAWSNLDSSRTYGGLTLAELEAAIGELDQAETHVASLEDQLEGARLALRTRRLVVWDMVKRARNGAKAQFGDDSEDYGRFGGIRSSERKRPRARPKD